MRKENYIGIAIEELYRIFDCINNKYYDNELQAPMIIIQSTKAGGRILLNGWFTLNKVWTDKLKEENKYEITICAEALQNNVVEICETMNHEIVHYYNKLKDIKDCYLKRHNKKFKEQAEKVDLICTKDQRIGYATSASLKFESFVKDIIKPNEDYFKFFRQVVDEKKVVQKTSFKYECPNCGLKVRAKKGITVICGECNINLEKEDEE